MATRVAVDAMGGDRAPEEIVAGALEARSEIIEPILFGPSGLDTGGLRLVEAADTIGMDEKPAEAVRSKPDSSLVAANRAVGRGDADVVVSAGNTGAMLAAGLLEIRRLKGVMRPAIAAVIPARYGATVLIDAGANADARPEHLLQFGHMGSVFAEEVLERANPEVRLLSIGEEDEKGNQLTLEAHALLAESSLNFRGNTEARELLRFAADVVVTDGFTGNVALKLLAERVEQGEARRPPDPAGRARAAKPSRPGHLRRRLPARAPRPVGDRPRELVPDGDRERDPPRGPRRGARRRGSSFRADGGRFRAPRRPRPNEVRWQRRAKKSSSESRKS